MDNFSNYNKLWKNSKETKPLIILIGGYCGTGKSTLANLIKEKIENINILPTGIIRSVLQSIYSKNEYPLLHEHTYKLFTLERYLGLTFQEATVSAYLDQTRLIEPSIENIISFAQSEGQQFIIEGNHILPIFSKKYSDKQNVISIFLKVSDRNQLIKNMTGPTHKRLLAEKEIDAACEIQQFILNNAKNNGVMVFEYNDLQQVLKVLEEKLGDILL